MGSIGLPNRLTLLRFLLAAGFLGSLFRYDSAAWVLVALGLFACAAFTDLLDGVLARRYGMESDFGRFMDPLADKVLTLIAFVFFVRIPEIAWPAWLVCLLIIRELSVNSLRTLAVNRGVVLEAATSGKYKTAVQMGGIGLVLLTLAFLHMDWIGTMWFEGVSWALMYLILGITVYSGVEYYYYNWPILRRSTRVD